MRLKNWAIALCSAAVAVGLSITAAIADTVEVIGNRVNVRSGPGTNYRVITVWNKGVRANRIKQSGSWAYVVTGRVEGWINTSYIRPIGTGNSGTTQRISFAPGTSGATVGGRVQGSQFRDYLLGARAGQRLTTSITGTSPYLQMLVLAPNGRTLYTGSANWSGVLPTNGDYRLRVRIVPEEQSSGASGEYSLTVTIR